jgi:hypothetical protein
MFLRELSVEDLPRIPSRDLVGDDRTDVFESHRIRGDPGTEKAIEDFTIAVWDGDERADAGTSPSSTVEGILMDLLPADSELTEVLVMLGFAELFGTSNDPLGSGAMTLGGRGNNGPFFRLGRRKMVVVVCTVCVVVVVVAYTPCSPELPSDLEDSDNRFTGSASVDVASSPYAGGKGPIP